MFEHISKLLPGALDRIIKRIKTMGIMKTLQLKKERGEYLTVDEKRFIKDSEKQANSNHLKESYNH